MSVSYPSKKVTIADVTDVRAFRAQFVYNFFTPSERVNVDVPDNIKLKAAETFEAARIDEISRFIPSFVKFEFIPVITQAEQGIGNEFSTSREESRAANQRRQYSKRKILGLIRSKGIINEDELSNRLFTTINFQDNNIDDKLRTFVSGSIAKRITSHNRLVQSNIEAEKNRIIDKLASGNESGLKEAGQALFEQLSTGDDEVDNWVIDAMATLDNYKMQLIDDDGTKTLVDETFSRIRDVTLKAQFNNKIIGQIMKNIVNDPMNQFSDEIKQLQDRAVMRELASRVYHNSNIIADSDYDTFFNAIDMMAGDAADNISRSRVVGYMIEKNELTSAGTPRKHQPIIIAQPDASTAIDTDIRYGSMYSYTIRTLAEVELTATDGDGEITRAVGLFTSKESNRVVVECTENVPPPPPADFNVIWDYQRKTPVLIWSFPTNPQRDIKAFQVFRRASINEPFQLLKEFDFDDSWVKTPRLETPDGSLVERNATPVLRFVDREFKKDSKFIYALASIDAHSLTSNYSVQYQIEFDSFKNRLKKSVISNSGAPKSYPNMSLNTDLFVDTIRDSNHTRVKVVFDPEALELIDSDGNRQPLFVTVPTNSRPNSTAKKYRLQFTNIDIQKQDTLDIFISDSRDKKNVPKQQFIGLSPSKFRVLKLRNGK